MEIKFSQTKFFLKLACLLDVLTVTKKRKQKLNQNVDKETPVAVFNLLFALGLE
jgi:hypothetical protein